MTIFWFVYVHKLYDNYESYQTLLGVCLYVQTFKLLSKLYTVHMAVHYAHYHIKSININFASDKYMHGWSDLL